MELTKLLCIILFLAGQTLAKRAKKCNKSQCKGPVNFYEEIKCLAIYARPGDCCPVRYDCSLLDRRSDEKCYAAGYEHDDGEVLNVNYPSHACKTCKCRKDDHSPAEFRCRSLECGFQPHDPARCFYQWSHDSCCGEPVCYDNPDDRQKCVVDGKSYNEGSDFYPSSSPGLSCYCMKGYKGKNVAPFCRKYACEIELKYSRNIRERCAPVYADDVSRLHKCPSAHRCQSVTDTVIHTHSYYDVAPAEMTCKFGNLTLHVGDELSKSKDSPCQRCVCEVPPFLSCMQEC